MDDREDAARRKPAAPDRDRADAPKLVGDLARAARDRLLALGIGTALGATAAGLAYAAWSRPVRAGRIRPAGGHPFARAAAEIVNELCELPEPLRIRRLDAVEFLDVGDVGDRNFEMQSSNRRIVFSEPTMRRLLDGRGEAVASRVLRLYLAHELFHLDQGIVDVQDARVVGADGSDGLLEIDLLADAYARECVLRREHAAQGRAGEAMSRAQILRLDLEVSAMFPITRRHSSVSVARKRRRFVSKVAELMLLDSGRPWEAGPDRGVVVASWAPTPSGVPSATDEGKLTLRDLQHAGRLLASTDMESPRRQALEEAADRADAGGCLACLYLPLERAKWTE